MSRLIEMIETAETIAVLGHIHPDGDCVGSCLAVCNYIREQYPEKVVQVYLEKPPVKFNYLKYFDEICQDAHTGKTYDLCICLDSAALDRLGEFAAYLDSAQASICLDHHVTNSGYAQENFVLEASSASEVVYGFLDLDKISIGCQVKVLDVEEDEEMEFKIVGSTEANSLDGKISNESPVGRALLGKKAGETVDVETQAGVIQYKILDIQRVS